MRLPFRGDLAAAETGSACGTSAKSGGVSVCSTQPRAAQRANTGATWAGRITGCQGAVGTAVVTLSLETAPKGYYGNRVFRELRRPVDGELERPGIGPRQ